METAETVENQGDVDGLTKVGRPVARVRDATLDALEPGITTAELDAMGEALLERSRPLSARFVRARPSTGSGEPWKGVARAHRLKVIRNLAGHGVGRSLHERPEDLVGYYRPGDRRRFADGMVLPSSRFCSPEPHKPAGPTTVGRCWESPVTSRRSTSTP